MRTETYTKNIYTLNEVKEEAIQANWDINVDYDWWEFVYADAEEIGLKITEFDLDRNNYCKGDIPSPITTAKSIIKNHGKECDTYKLAKSFLAEVEPLIAWVDKVDDSRFDLYNRGGVSSTYHDKQDQIEDLELEFKRDLLNEYASILQKEYDYLTSKEAIEETLRCNGYEFNEDGTIN